MKAASSKLGPKTMARRRVGSSAAATSAGGAVNRNSAAAWKGKRKQRELVMLQDSLLSSDYILKELFRKDGPPLGVEFDSLPASAFCRCTGSTKTRFVSPENQRMSKRRKVVKPAVPDRQACNDKKSAPVMKHGRGKGLMTVWRVTNPGAGFFPTGIDFSNRVTPGVSRGPASKSRKAKNCTKRPQNQKPVKRRLGNKLEDKKKMPTVRRRKVECKKDGNHHNIHNETCGLALEGGRSEELLSLSVALVDDEELELRELQSGPNPLTCSAHFSTNGLHSCSLCKDLLAKFPPDSVKTKQPFSMQPWDSSPELVKKLFKIFHFLYTYAVTIDICPFTLDEFAEAFHDKDSLLLGKVHVALLELLLSSLEMELSNGFVPCMNKNFMFLGLLHSVEHRDFVVKFWKKFLNPLTWTEILRQVFVAAGFGSKAGTLRREYLNKEVDLIVKYGLRPGTLKCELFRILSEQGNNGLKVSEMARFLQIVDLDLASTTDELELLISSTLASDITLFEKISSSTYRLRINSGTKAAETFHSDTEDSGSVEDDSMDGGSYSSCDVSECDSVSGILTKHKSASHFRSKNNVLTMYTEIDESHPGEAWLLGLMEGEYSALSIEEKLDALVALLDLLSAASSFTVEDPLKVIAEYIPTSLQFGSGGKIKRSTAKVCNLPRTSVAHVGQMPFAQLQASSEIHPVDSSSTISKFCGTEKSSGLRVNTTNLRSEVNLHPMQSVFLGSDRRYNRYWLFLGPCTSDDPGHNRVYFESSEDGHWEVIDTEEALCSLLSVLDNRGRREAVLLASLGMRETFLCQAMSSRMVNYAGSRRSDISEIDVIREDSTSPVSDVDNNLCLTEINKDSMTFSGAVIVEFGKKGEEQKQKWNRLQAFDAWIWHSFYYNLNSVKHSKRSYLDTLTRCESCHDLYWRDEKHCRTCHLTFELDFDLEERYAIHAATCREKEGTDMFPNHKVLSSQLQSLKAAIHAIESVMPKDSLIGAWTKSAHKLWIKRLRRTSSLAELLQVLADFVAAINEDWLCQCNAIRNSDSLLEEVACFPGIPQTSSAVAFWLVKLDALVAAYTEKVQSEQMQGPTERLKGRRTLKL